MQLTNKFISLFEDSFKYILLKHEFLGNVFANNIRKFEFKFCYGNHSFEISTNKKDQFNHNLFVKIS